MVSELAKPVNEVFQVHPSLVSRDLGSKQFKQFFVVILESIKYFALHCFDRLFIVRSIVEADQNLPDMGY